MKEEVDPDGQLMKTFVKLSSTIEASLPEEIGVEFLLRDINDSNKSPVHKLVFFYFSNYIKYMNFYNKFIIYSSIKNLFL